MTNSDFNHDPDDREIEMMLKYVPAYSADNERNIKDKFALRAKMQRNRVSFKKAAAALAAAVMIFVTAISALAYADVIDMGRIYRAVFGENSEYIELHIEPLDGEYGSAPAALVGNDNGEDTSHAEYPPRLQITSEYDGIVVRLISAINDENVLRIFAAVTDTTGDRLGESLEFTDWFLSQGYGGNVSTIGYDAVSKTATVMITSLGDDHRGLATLTVDGLSTGRELLEDLPESHIDIVELVNRHSPNTISQDEVWKEGGGGELHSNSRLLKADEIDIQLKNTNIFSISNLGFVDGVLHVQTKASAGGGAFVDGYFINLRLVSPEEETAYDEGARLDFVGREYAFAESRNEPFDKYSEFIFKNITTPEQLIGLSLVIGIMKPPVIIEGHWEFSFIVPEKATKEFHVDREIIVDGEKIRISMVSLSPLGVTIHLPKNMAATYGHSDTVYIEYGDGTVVELNQSSIHGYESGSSLIFGGQFIEIENVQSIVVNGERITASPGQALQ